MRVPCPVIAALLIATKRLAGVCPIALLLVAAPVNALTLDQALAQAYRRNPVLQAQRSRLQAAQARLAEARAGGRPGLRLSGAVGSEYVDTELAPAMGGSILTRNLTPGSVSLALQQSLYDGGGTSAAVSSASNSVLAEQARLQQAEQTLFQSVASAYLDVLLNQSIVALEQHNVDTLHRQLAATRLRKQAGELTPTDVFQAQARLAQATARQRRAEARLAQFRAAYLRAVGSPAEQLTPPAPVAGLSASLQQAQQQASEQSPQLLQASYAVAAAQDQVRSIRAHSGPSISLIGEIRHDQDDSIFTDRTDTRRIMLTAAVPLYTGGADSARRRQAEQIAAQRMAQLDAQRSQVNEAVTDAWASWQAAHAELAAYLEQRRAAEAALAGVRAEQRAGARTVLDVLNAQQESLNAQVSVAAAEHDQQLAAVRLLAATGQLTAAALQLSLQHSDKGSVAAAGSN